MTIDLQLYIDKNNLKQLKNIQTIFNKKRTNLGVVFGELCLDVNDCKVFTSSLSRASHFITNIDLIRGIVIIKTLDTKYGRILKNLINDSIPINGIIRDNLIGEDYNFYTIDISPEIPENYVLCKSNRDRKIKRLLDIDE